MRRLIASMIMVLSVFCFRSGAQEQFVLPPAKLVTTLPFKTLTGGIIIIEARFDSLGTNLNFVLDTGSGGISLDSSTAQELHITSVRSNRIIHGIAGAREVSFAYNHQLRLPGLTVNNLNFHINDYDLLTSVYGIKIDGIIGLSFLSRYIVGIDYDSSRISVYSRGAFQYPRGGFYLHPRIGSLPVQHVFVRDARSLDGRYFLDTGAGLCMLLSYDFVNDSSLLNKKRRIYSTQAEGLGGKKKMGLTIVKEVHIGPYRFRKVPVYLFKDDFNVTEYPAQNGLLGNDLMRRFNVVINYGEQTVYIKPNSHYDEPFDYSYTGLGIYVVDNQIQVIDVIPGSPGDKAGFREGDRILAIDRNFSNDIQAYKALLQNPRARMDVVVQRGAEIVGLKLRIKNILDRR